MTPEPYRALERYFARIVNTTPEKMTMFEYLKNKWTELTTTKYVFVEEDPKLYEDGYWAFGMYTPDWIDVNDGKVEPIHTVLIEPHEGTWMEVLDAILDSLGKHYGYSIKEQVYYSVNFPLNKEGFAGYGRSLNDELFQQLLLAHPEVYESQMFGKPTTDLFA